MFRRPKVVLVSKKVPDVPIMRIFESSLKKAPLSGRTLKFSLICRSQTSLSCAVDNRLKLFLKIGRALAVRIIGTFCKLWMLSK